VGGELIRRVAELLRERNAIDASIAQIIGRPVASGHLGEWAASQIFDIDLEESASAAGIDGRFRAGPLQGHTVNIKWYMKHQGLLDTTESAALDYYLILAGPPVSGRILAWQHAPLVHPVCLPIRCPAASSRAGCPRSQARRRLQRDEAAMGRRGDLPGGRQPVAASGTYTGGAAQALPAVTSRARGRASS